MSKAKLCSKCLEEKPLGEFGRLAKAKDGLQHHCRSCVSAYKKQLTAKLVARTNGKYWRMNKDREKAADRTKYRVRRMLERAVARGTVVKPEACEVCGRTGVRICGHHKDYSKPRDVDWLCTRCHADAHAKCHGKRRK